MEKPENENAVTGLLSCYVAELKEIIQKIKKPFSLEEKNNYSNLSVINGFDKYVINWAGEAIKVLQKAQKFDPSCAEIYYHLGLVYEAKNNLHESRCMYLKAVEVDPKFTLAHEHLDKLVGK